MPASLIINYLPSSEQNSGPSSDSDTLTPSAALWMATMAVHYMTFGWPPRQYFTPEKLATAVDTLWVLYLEQKLDEEAAGKVREGG